MKILLPILLASLVVLSLSPAAKGDYHVQSEGNTFKVTWIENAVQNLTSWPLSATVYPQNLNYTLSGTDLAQFSTAVQTNIQQKGSPLTVSDAALHLTSNGANSSCSTCLQWLNVSATFRIHDSAPLHAGVAQYDMSWIPIRLDQDLTVANVAYNLLGQHYLLTAILPFIQFTSSSDRSMTMHVNRSTITRVGYQPVVEGIVFFDMSTIHSKIEDWTHSLDFSKQTQTWTSPETGGFNFTASEHIVSENTDLVYVAGARVAVQVSTSMNTMVKANTLYVDFSGGFWDLTSLAIIVASIGALATTVVIDRRLTRTYGQRRKNRKG